MTKLFQHTEKNPFHISVGAVAVGKDGKILVHKRTKENIPDQFAYMLGGLPEAYALMRESVENDESLDRAVVRGLQEEFGATGVVRQYIGALNFMHSWKERIFEKTVLYFVADITELGERPDDVEAWTELCWVEPEVLLEKMREQALDSNRPEPGEEKIIEAYLKYGKS